MLLQLVDDCGLVLPRRETGLCYNHQKKVTKVLARSIAMGVLSWKKGPIRYLNPFSPPMFSSEINVPEDVAQGNKPTW